ncbi:hypothetical protein Cgig2_001575 [Carnegiea gigantea]|uniref:Uncharacterized protein n=1 Tax=Carnegiea gigantea TaxID=171969 RepID=A0A9Q1JVW5_9CARY|nr:hypothetical protein Cgig2_001575 [Carnegiea gigantea]
MLPPLNYLTRQTPISIASNTQPPLNNPEMQPPSLCNYPETKAPSPLVITQKQRSPLQLPKNEAPPPGVHSMLLLVVRCRPPERHQQVRGPSISRQAQPLIWFEGINGTVMAASASGKKSTNWTNRDDEKLLDILIKQKVQGAVKFEWSLVRVMLKNEGIKKESIQIKNRCKTRVGVDDKTAAVVVSDSTWQDFLQRFGGKYKSFRKKVPANLKKDEISILREVSH